MAITREAAAVSSPGGLEAAGAGVTRIDVSSGKAPALVLDLGTDTGGWVEVRARASGSVTLHLAYSEARAQLSPGGDGSASIGVDDDPQARAEDVPLTAQMATWRSPGIRGAERWILLEAHGDGVAEIDYVRVDVTHMLESVDDPAGWFLSSDPVLNRSWYASAHTLYDDTVRRSQSRGWVIIDGAKRDRLVFSGDLGIEGLTAYYALPNGGQAVANSLALLACQQQLGGYLPPGSQINTVCPQHASPGGVDGANGEYVAWFVIDATEYLRFTGRREFVMTLLPRLERAVGWLRDHISDGLYERGPGEWNWHPDDPQPPRPTGVSDLIVLALRDLSWVELQFSRPRAGQADLRAASTLAGQVRAQDFDAQAGLFGAGPGGARGDHSQDANVDAVLAGVVDERRARALLDTVRKTLWGPLGVGSGSLPRGPYDPEYVSPFVSSQELLARCEVGDVQGALTLIRRLWGRMTEGEPGDTVWERVAADGDVPGNGEPPSAMYPKGLISRAHGWSSGPVAALSGRVLGVRPVAPGFRTWLVAPTPADLSWAQGRVQTPRGPITVRWQHNAAGFTLTVSGPTGGFVGIPLLARSRALWRDGIPLSSQLRSGPPSTGADEARVWVHQEGGVHTYAW